jgi:hypothetical protein
MKVSYIDCPHRNVDGYTSECSDCGYNVWTTNEEYLKDLRRKAKKWPNLSEVRSLEKQLGIGVKDDENNGSKVN